MLLEKLILENYGVYAEKTEFDLSTSKKKPIVLVGGLNGAGKTTILESMMVALYGKTYLGLRVTKKEYLEFISDRIHRPAQGKRASHASVEITFQFHHNGSEDTYTINRSWDVEGASVSESLLIHKNGETMTDINESLWQSFIEGLIPIGIARLFFFDGEKIVRVTKWENGENKELQASLDVLLGTEFVNRLDADLTLYAMRQSGSNAQSKESENQYKELQKEKDDLTSDIISLDAEHAKKTTELEDILSEISVKESKIAGIGGGYADIRNNLFTQKAVLEEKLRHQGKDIQDDLANDAPLYLAKSLLGKIMKQLRSDIKITQQKFSISLISDRVKTIKKEISSEKFWSGNPVNDTTLEKMQKLLDSLIENPTDTEFFDMSPKDMEWMEQMMVELQDGSALLSSKLEEYGKTNMRLAKTDSDLVKIPRDDEIGPRISDINNLHQEVGMLKTDLANIEQSLVSKRAYQKILQSKLKGFLDALHKNKTSSTGVKLASTMQKVLQTYYENLQKRKIDDLESHLLGTLSILLHKKLLSKIEIDRDNFEIRAYRNNDDDEPIPGGLLSMGERQMIGTALLWAIARTCGRSLPFVIDTPLGRLDGEHLVNLTDKFYPFVSHQLILLSTDREISEKELDRMSKYISRSYHISYDDSQSRTFVNAGYFVKEEKSIA